MSILLDTFFGFDEYAFGYFFWILLLVDPSEF